MVTFSEVRCDYREPDTNKYLIDAWISDDDNEEGISIASVDEDGVVDWIKGNSIMYLDKENYANLWEAIEEAIEKQKEHKKI